jgi:hypothetical protein
MRLGTVTFQANDSRDIFYVADVIESGVEASDEVLLGIEDSQFESSLAFITGLVPKVNPVSIEGDTISVAAWFKADGFTDPFVVRVYVEYEETEELVGVKDEEIESTDPDPLDPIEIHL